MKFKHFFHITITFRVSENSSSNGDTLSQNDFVVQHYENLPYPPFSKLDMNEEYNYYKQDIESIPKFGVPTNTLENLNHFLFKGKENFRCVNGIQKNCLVIVLIY